MGFFSQTIDAHLQEKQIGAALLCFMEFKDTPRRWWAGGGTLAAGGHEWLGAGDFISIEGLEPAMGTAAPKTTFTLSGVDSTVVQLARNASGRVKGRRATVYIQFFDISPDDNNLQPWATLDQPYAIWSGIMDQMKYGAQGPSSRTVTVTAESLWVGRNRPPYGMYTDRDQNARFPGDRGLEQVVNLLSKTLRWPIF